MKLKTKIRLFSSLFMLLLIVLVNASIYFLFYKISADTELEQLSNQTDTIVETLMQHPDIPKEQMLSAFVPENGIIRVISAEEDELITTRTKRKAFTELPYQYVDHEVKEISRDEEGVLIANVYKPIIWDTGEIVTLQVANYLFSLDEVMNTLLYVLIAASIIMLIPTIVAGNLLSKFILQPIQKLIETMRANIKEENWQTIDLQTKSKDELFEMEKTFNELIVHLKDSFTKQEQFVSDASHELKTPISIIKSYAELLKRRGKQHPEVFEESVDVIHSEADRMQLLVSQLLDLVKNKQSPAHTKFDLVPLVKQVYQIFTNAYQREISLDMHEESVFVHGNEEQIEQVIYILLSNAIKYSDQEIEIKLLERNGVAILSVVDYGPGISDEDQKRIFDRFYRVDKARTRKSGGTGLGLAIAKEIVEAHDGNISVTSELGKCSKFFIELPIVKNN